MNNVSPKGIHILVPETCDCELTLKEKKGLCRCDYVKDPEMGRLFYIIIVGPKCDHGVFVIGRQRRITHTEKWRRQCDDANRDWSDVVTIQGLPAAPKSWKRQRMAFPLELPERAQPTDPLIWG